MVATWLFIGTLSPVAIGAPPQVVTEADAAAAAELLAAGKKAHAAGKLEAARAAFEQAYRLDPRPIGHAANLGTVELSLGRYRDAAEHLADALTRLEIDAPKAQFDSLSKSLQAARAEVGEVQVEVSAPSELRVDDKLLGAVHDKRAVYVDPGTHTLSAQAPGYRNASAQVVVDKGQRHAVRLELLPDAPAAATPRFGAPPPNPVAPDTTSPAPGRRSIVPLIVGGAAAAVATGIGIGLLVHSGSRADDAEAMRQELYSAYGPGPCGAGLEPAAVAPCADLRDVVDAQYGSRNAAVGFFIGAGVAAGAGVATYFLLPRRARPSAEAWRVEPVVGTGAGAVRVEGSF